MTDEWRDKLHTWIDRQYGTAGWEQKLENLIDSLLDQATSKEREEERNRIKTILIHKGWHETSCPAHSNNMRSESECDCLYSFVLESLKRDK